ncbi:hypothetical protein ACLMJK_001750 [Lecanora helva]
MHHSNILITGAFSGIGKAFVRAYLEHHGNNIVAIDKDFPLSLPSNEINVDDQKAIDAYRKDVGDDRAKSRLTIMSMDITDEAQLTQLCSLKDLKVVIHSAGVRGLVPSVPISQSTDVAKAETMDVMTSQIMAQTFHVNTIGTFLLLRTLTPVLQSTAGKVIVMGSRMGSIGHNRAGGGYAYRSSKAAVNAVTKGFSVDVPKVTFVTLHPGRVESGLVGGGVKEDGAIEARESVKGMLPLISQLGHKDSGRFMDRFGEDIVW